tara:strand:+ start:1323 stop:1508 length:186 start_codon:yes stop_codon:yes gene_type:complete
MADIKTITQELNDASLNLTSSINTINDNLLGTASNTSHDEIKSILTKILEKLDELVEKVNS